jgi:uncharacterized protein YbaR (Trm112 family)
MEGRGIVICPKCGGKMPYRRLMLIKTWNPKITCPICKSKLSIANRGICRLLGFIGGWTGALVLMLFFMNPSLMYAWGALVLWITFILAMPLVEELKPHPYEMGSETTKTSG